MKRLIRNIILTIFIGQQVVYCQEIKKSSLFYSTSFPSEYYCSTASFDVYFFENRISYVLKNTYKQENQFKNNSFSIASYYTTAYRVDMKWLNYDANQLNIINSDTVPIKFNNFNNQLIKKTGSAFNELIYKNIYPNIDLRFYFIGNELKYDFVVKKGGNYEAIQLYFDGASTALSSNKKKLIITTPLGNIVEEMPEVYQIKQSKKVALTANYQIKNNTVSYFIKDVDVNHTIIIDPSATYFGGSDIEEVYDLKIDSKNNSYLVGYTNSSNLPTTVGVLQDSIRSFTDAFIAKFDSTDNLVWVTYYGGTADDFGYKLIIDSIDNLYLIGYTSSNDLLVSTSGVFQSVNNGSIESFILKLDTNGNFLKATYFGGTGGEITLAAAIDNNQKITIGGFTSSMDMPILNASQPIFGGALDAFVAQFDSSLNLIWTSYYGGSNSEDVHALTTDNQNNIIFVGESFSSDFPTTTGAFQQGNILKENRFAKKIKPE